MMRFACLGASSFSLVWRFAIRAPWLIIDDIERMFSDLASAGVADLGVGALDR